MFEFIPSNGEDVVIVNASKSLKGKWLVDNVKMTPEVVLQSTKVFLLTEFFVDVFAFSSYPLSFHWFFYGYQIWWKIFSWLSYK